VTEQDNPSLRRHGRRRPTIHEFACLRSDRRARGCPAAGASDERGDDQEGANDGDDILDQRRRHVPPEGPRQPGARLGAAQRPDNAPVKPGDIKMEFYCSPARGHCQ
jgi:hypothetical protein